MYFDPTHDYSDADLNISDNIIRWKFSQLIENLVILSSSAQRQAEIIGVGAVCEEMALDFETYFTLEYPNYLETGLLTMSQLEKLQELDNFFEEKSGNNSPDFWDDLLLEKSLTWQVVRQKAQEILVMLDMQSLTIDFERTEKAVDTGNPIMMQITKTRLVKSKLTNR